MKRHVCWCDERLCRNVQWHRFILNQTSWVQRLQVSVHCLHAADVAASSIISLCVCFSGDTPPPHTHTPLQTHTPPPHGQFSHQSIFCSGAPRPVNPSSVCVCVPLINIFTSPRSEMILSSSLQPSSIGVRGGCSQRIRRRSESWAAVTTADWQPAPYILRAVGQIDASERGSCHRLTLAVICCRVFVCNLHRRLLSRR